MGAIRTGLVVDAVGRSRIASSRRGLRIATIAAAGMLAGLLPVVPWAGSGEAGAAPAVDAVATLVVACRDGRPALLGVFEAADGAIVFSLPGGGARAGEDAATAAERETLEETGYRVRADRALPTPDTADSGLRLIQARVVERRRARPASSEIVAAAWVDPRRIPAKGWRFPRDSQWVARLFERHAPADCD